MEAQQGGIYTQTWENIVPGEVPEAYQSNVIYTQKLLDRHNRDGVLVEKPLHQNQFAYRTGMSTEMALFRVVHRLEKSLIH